MESTLANIWSDGGDTVMIELLFVIREYADVFPNTLPGIPPGREMEFTIELSSGTTIISFPTTARWSPQRWLKQLKELQKS